jgi:hypothetical protein
MYHTTTTATPIYWWYLSLLLCNEWFKDLDCYSILNGTNLLWEQYIKCVLATPLRLWDEIFHMVPGINPRPISALQLRCRAWYGSLGLIPGPIWKMSYNNLLILTLRWHNGLAHMTADNNIVRSIFYSYLFQIYQAMSICTMTLETVC